MRIAMIIDAIDITSPGGDHDRLPAAPPAGTFP